MKRLLVASLAAALLAGCVVTPYGGYREGYYRDRDDYGWHSHGYYHDYDYRGSYGYHDREHGS